MTAKPDRFSPSHYTALSILLLVFGLGIANAEEAVVFHSYGAVAEKCGQVAIDEGPGFFSMVLRLEIHDEEVHFKQCGPNSTTSNIEEEKFLIPSWMEANASRIVRTPLKPTGAKRRRRFLPVLFGIAGLASAVVSVRTSLYTFKEIYAIKSKMQRVNEHLAYLDPSVSSNHDTLVKITH